MDVKGHIVHNDHIHDDVVEGSAQGKADETCKDGKDQILAQDIAVGLLGEKPRT